MSVKITSTNLTGSLWPKKPTICPDGQLVEASFEDLGELSAGARFHAAQHSNHSSLRFTAIVYTPDDALRFVASDSSGTIYLFSMKKNRYTVVARLNTNVTALCFGKDKNTIHAAGGMMLYTINLDTARIESRVKTPHSNNITQLASPIYGTKGQPFYSTKFVSMSKESITYWSVGDGKANLNTRAVESQLAAEEGGMAMSTGLSAASAGAHPASPLPVGRALAPSVKGFFNSIAMSDGYIYVVDSGNGTIASFSTKPNVPTASLSSGKSELPLVSRVSVGEKNHPINLALASDYVMVGTKTSQGRVLFLKTVGLEGISAVSLPLPKDVSSIGTTVASVAVCPGANNGLAAAQLSDGKIWFINVMAYSAIFSIFPKINARFTSIGGILPNMNSRITFGHEDYLGMVFNNQSFVFHLRTAKAYFDRHSAGFQQQAAAQQQQLQQSAQNNNGESTSASGDQHQVSMLPPDNRSAMPFVKAPGEREDENNGDPNASTGGDSMNQTGVQVGLTRTVLSVDTSRSSRRSGGSAGNATPANTTTPSRDSNSWIKVNLVDRAKEMKALTTEQQPLIVKDAIDETFSTRKEGDTTAGEGDSGSKKPSTLANRKKPVAGSNTVGKGNPPVSLRPFLDKDSQVLNFEKLRGMLMKFGCFPDRYRSLIWRFMLQIPDKQVTAPHFHNLTAKGLHPGVPALMKPFPLPDSRLRVAFEKVLSALAHHAPVFSVVHWIPSACFPIVKMFGSDVQSSVEVILSFFLNWGQEWFVYYPHPPVAILNFVSHTLKAEDSQLWHHLQECAVGTDDWIWEVIQPLYSEVLSRGEWLQLMDHAVSNEPLWLFLFHVRWMISIRDVLLGLQDHGEVLALLHRNIPIDFNKTLQQTYRLHSRIERNDLTEPYHNLLHFDETGYPITLVANDCVVTSKVRELEKIEEHEKQASAMKQRTVVLEKQLAQAAMLEDAFVAKQKALVAAKFDASNNIWEQQVSLEKERQHLRDIEQASRLDAVEEQLRSAQRLYSLQEEVKAANATIKDAEVDRQRETMKWDFADKMTHLEMDRIEEATKNKLKTALNVAQQELVADRELHLSLAAEQQVPVVVDRTNVQPQRQQQKSSANYHHQEEDLQQQQHDRHQQTQQVVHHRDDQQAQQNYSVLHTTADIPDRSTSPPQTDTSVEVHQHRAATTTAQSQHTSSSSSSTSAPPPMAARTVPPPAPPQQQQQGRGLSTPSSSNDATSTSAPTTSTDPSDPVGYYSRLRNEVTQGVLRAQAQQRAALGHLRSDYGRFSQGSTAEEGQHAVSVQASRMMATHQQQQLRQQATSRTVQTTSSRAALYDDAEGEEEEGATAAYYTQHHHQMQENDDGDSSNGTTVTEEDLDAASSSQAFTDGSSMYHAITRPQPRSTYDVRRAMRGEQ